MSIARGLRKGRRFATAANRRRRKTTSAAPFSACWAQCQPTPNSFGYIATITPVQDVLRRPEIVERLRAARKNMEGALPVPPPGPDRQQLLELLK